MAPEVEFFTIDSMIKGYHVYKDVWPSFKCCTVAMMKEVEKGLLSRLHAAAKPAAKPAEMYTLQSTCKETG